MPRTLTILLLFLLVGVTVRAQYNLAQNGVWAFGKNAGVDFITGTAVPFTTALNTMEGTASVGDATGQLLFYTQGQEVYNRLNTSMGSIVTYSTTSTTQAAVIVPYPAHPAQYFVFSLQEHARPNSSRLSYIQVDMTLAGGLGGLAGGSRLLDSVYAEKMTVVPGANCALWVLVHARDSATFFAYPVSSTGVGTPVKSHSGTIRGDGTYAVGVIKSSNNGRLIVCQVSGPYNGTELHDFDPVTGIVSNCRVLNSLDYNYGAEFSPDDSKLFVGEVTGVNKITQYDLSLPSTAAIIASARTVIAGGGSFVTDLRLAPDGQIYFNSYTGANYLDCIPFPNVGSGGCGYTGRAVYLGATREGRLGLPARYWEVGPGPIAGLPYGTICPGTTFTLSVATAGGTWSSSSTSVATIGSSSGVVRAIAAGTAVISYVSGICGHSTITLTVGPLAPISGPTTLCVGASTTLSLPGSTSGTWSSSNPTVATIGSATAIVTGLSVGSSTITYSYLGCSAYHIVYVSNMPTVDTIRGPDSVCVLGAIRLTNAVGGGLWQVGSSGRTAIAGGVLRGILPGLDTVRYTVTTPCGTATTSKTILVLPLPNAGAITGLHELCLGSVITLSNTATGGSWSVASGGAVASISISGIYCSVSGIVTGVDNIIYSVSNSCGTAVASHSVTLVAMPDSIAITGPDNLCTGDAITLSCSGTGGNWSRVGAAVYVGASGEVSGVSAGTAIISYFISNACGNTLATHTVQVHPAPATGSISGIARICVGGSFTLSSTASGGTWATASGMVGIDTSSGRVVALAPGTATISYTVGPDTHGCTGIATIDVAVLMGPEFGVMANIVPVRCYGLADGSIVASLTGNTGTNSYAYTWNTGDTLSTVDSLPAGTYELLVREMPTQCSLRVAYMVTQPTQLGAVAAVKNDLCLAGKGSIRVTAEGATPPYTYKWWDNTQASSVAGLHSGTYTLNITDSNGCARDYEYSIKDDSCSNLDIHDVITPNADGSNDVWVIEGLMRYTSNNVQVFDKWGDKLYERDDYQNDWGGRALNGQLLPDGTYIYLIKLRNDQQAEEVYKGTLLIKR